MYRLVSFHAYLFSHHVHKLLDFWVCSQRSISPSAQLSTVWAIANVILWFFFLTCNSIGTMHSLLLFTCWLNRAEISQCILVGVISCLFVFPSMHTNFLIFGYASKEYLSVCSAVYCLSNRKLDAYQRPFASHSSLPVILLVLICTACYSLHVA